MNRTGNRRKYSDNQDPIEGEIWSETRFNGFFVSSKGRIKNKDGVLKQSRMTKDYARIKIGQHYHAVHRLVAISFIKNPYSLPQVNHIDGDKDNNFVENLEWCTLQENMKHAERLHLNPGARGERNANSIISDSVAKALFRFWATTSLTHTEISHLTGLTNRQLRKIKCNGREHLDNYKNHFING